MTSDQFLTLIAAVASQTQFEQNSLRAKKAWVTRRGKNGRARALKAWVTRRRNAAKRSARAIRAWETRRLTQLGLRYGFPIGRAG